MNRNVAAVLLISGSVFLSNPAIAQSGADKANQASASAEACARLGPDIPALANSIMAGAVDDRWRHQMADWMIEQFARSMADELTADGKAPSYTTAYKGALDAGDLHRSEIDQEIRAVEPALNASMQNTLCAQLSADDIRAISAFIASPAGQHYRAVRQSSVLQLTAQPAFGAMVKSILEASRHW